MKGLGLVRVSRILDRAFLIAVLSGFGMLMIALVFYAYYNDYDPFPTFGGDARLDHISHWILLAVGGLGLAWAISFGRRYMRRPDLPNPIPGFALGLAGVFVAACGWDLAIPTLNAVLDFGPKVVTPVHVQGRFITEYSTAHGTKLPARQAVVNRLDHPDEAVEVSWPKCNKVGGIPSRLVTIKLGRGAFGVPWFSRAIGCRRLTFDEPLFDDFYLGKGRAAVLVSKVGEAGNSKGEAERVAQLGEWTRAIEGRSPDLRIALLTDAWTVAPEHHVTCPRCRAAVKEEVDSDILNLVSDTVQWGEDNRVYLVDGKGRMVFEAALSDTEQIPGLLDKLSHAE